MKYLKLFFLTLIIIGFAGGEAALAKKKKKPKLAPGDIAYERTVKAKEFPPVIFEHWRHISQYRCYVCHSSLFEMQVSQGLGEDMHKTNSCGSCHDGKPGFAIGVQTCHRCHISKKNADAGAKKKK